jgi:phospho-N-acetylmuramoyl-pentapeptide-transferase
MSGAAVVSLLLVLLLGPRMIRFLVRQKLGDRPEFDHADLNRLTQHKSNTPTMGGALIVIAIFVSVLLFANCGNMYIRIAMVMLLLFGSLGAVDDWIKLRHAAGKGTRDGLHPWEKILFQIGFSVLAAVFTYAYGRESYVWGENPAHSFYFLFKATPIYLPLGAYVIITVLTMFGACNAVNLTDGMDGLAAGCTTICAGVFLILAWIVGVARWASVFNLPLVAGSAEMTVLCAAIAGACLGFLWYNSHPAQVFMGDTGSLSLGALVGYVAVVTRQELLLLLAGGVFVMEAASVLMQISYFRITRSRGAVEGRRLFRCAPLHHHFHLGGWSEPKVVARFWVLGILFAALALATLKLR